MARCLEIFGVTEHLWLDRPDGGCASISDDEGAAQIARIIEQVRPQTVLTFGPDGMTGHSDHAAVCRWTTLAFDNVAPPGASLHYATTVPEWFEAWKPIADRLNIMMDESLVVATPRDQLSIDLRPPQDVLDGKIEALRAQKTQTAPLFEAVGESAFRDWISDEYYRLARQA
jgi:LmbE family N-acetylglucosaminyl deacetylase